METFDPTQLAPKKYREDKHDWRNLPGWQRIILIPIFFAIAATSLLLILGTFMSGLRWVVDHYLDILFLGVAWLAALPVYLLGDKLQRAITFQRLDENAARRYENLAEVRWYRTWFWITLVVYLLINILLLKYRLLWFRPGGPLDW